MIFQVTEKHTPTLNRIIQSLRCPENFCFRFNFNPGTTHKNLEKKALKIYQFCLELKKYSCKGEILQTPSTLPRHSAASHWCQGTNISVIDVLPIVFNFFNSR